MRCLEWLISSPHNHTRQLFADVIAEGFQPKPFVRGRSFIEHQRENYKVIILVMLHAILSQIIKWYTTKITSTLASRIDATDATIETNDIVELATHKTTYETLIQDVNNIISQINELEGRIMIVCLTDILTTNLDDIELIDDITKINKRIIESLLKRGINPSIDTMEYAVSRLNFDIFYKCKRRVNEYRTEYIKLQRSRDYMVHLHHRDDEHSLIQHFYENIKNIAYNVFYNHEYVLPLECSDTEFDGWVRHLLQEEMNEVAPDAAAAATVRNPFEALTDMSDGSQTQYESSVSPSPYRAPRDSRQVISVGNRSRSRGGGKHTRNSRNKSYKRSNTRRRVHNRSRRDETKK